MINWEVYYLFTRVRYIFVQNLATSLCVPSVMYIPTPHESEGTRARASATSTYLCLSFYFIFFPFSFFFPFNEHSFSKDMLDMFRVKRTCENVLRRSFHVQSITSPKVELRRWTNIELNPTNQKWIRKNPIRFVQRWPEWELTQITRVVTSVPR